MSSTCQALTGVVIFEYIAIFPGATGHLENPDRYEMKKPTQKVKSKKRSRQRKTSTDSSLGAVTVTEESVDHEGAQAKPSPAVQKRTVQPKNEKSENAFTKLFKKTGQFLRDAKTELKKVKWPTRKELLASTAVVIVLTILIAIFLGLVDFGLIKIIKHVV